MEYDRFDGEKIDYPYASLGLHSNLYCKYYFTRNGNSPKIFHVRCEEHQI